MAEWDWIRDPFSSEARERCVLTGRAQEELIDVASDRSLQLLFRESKNLGQFWVFVAKEYPNLGAAALKVLVPFSTTYLCESGFSALTAMKTKYRSRLQPSEDMRVSLSRIIPRLDMLCSKKQAHPSH